MKSIQIVKPAEMHLIDQNPPDLGPEEVIVKIKYVGFCGSDIRSFLGKNPLVKYPVIPGHEVSGHIHQTGEDVPPQMKPGQKATLIPYTNCGECASCKRGRPNACRYNQTLGVQRNGAMSEYLAVHWSKLLISDMLSMEELALVEPLTVGFHAVSRGRVEGSDIVAVLGCGIIGIGALIGALNNGAKVIAIDIDDSKLRIAQKLGATYTINCSNEDLEKRLNDLTEGFGPDVIIEAAGHPKTYLAAIQNIAFTGRVVCIGYAKDDISFATKLFVQKELDILGSRNATSEDFNKVMDYIESGRLSSPDLISKIVPPERAFDAISSWVSNPGSNVKILVDFEI